MPEVDAVIGTNELDRIVDLCEGMRASGATSAGPYLYHDLTPRVLATPKHFAYIKIAEGCDHPCTFCVIPQYRGSIPQPPLRVGGRARPRACSSRAFARST